MTITEARQFELEAIIESFAMKCGMSKNMIAYFFTQEPDLEQINHDIKNNLQGRKDLAQGPDGKELKIINVQEVVIGSLWNELYKDDKNHDLLVIHANPETADFLFITAETVREHLKDNPEEAEKDIEALQYFRQERMKLYTSNADDYQKIISKFESKEVDLSADFKVVAEKLGFNGDVQNIN